MKVEIIKPEPEAANRLRSAIEQLDKMSVAASDLFRLLQSEIYDQLEALEAGQHITLSLNCSTPSDATLYCDDGYGGVDDANIKLDSIPQEFYDDPESGTQDEQRHALAKYLRAWADRLDKPL